MSVVVKNVKFPSFAACAAHESRSARSVEPAKNPALNYAQRTYTDKDFEGFFVDLSDGEGK